jgi:hypothetical protein
MEGGKKRKMKAWLVIWEWCGDHAKRDDPFAAILNPRLSAKRVRDLVGFIYRSATYSLSEQAEYARNKKHNPYPAEYFERTKDNIPWGGEIICGHNPFLRARLVDDFVVERNAEGKEKASWKERPRPVSLAAQGR